MYNTLVKEPTLEIITANTSQINIYLILLITLININLK